MGLLFLYPAGRRELRPVKRKNKKKKKKEEKMEANSVSPPPPSSSSFSTRNGSSIDRGFPSGNDGLCVAPCLLSTIPIPQTGIFENTTLAIARPSAVLL